MANPTLQSDLSRLRDGTLQDVPFGVLLQALAARKRTVVVDLERHQMRKTVVIEDGVPVDCRSNLVHETLGRFLAASGRLGDAEAGALIRESLTQGVPLGQVLLAKGLIAPIELFRLLQQNLAKKLLDLFTWNEGRFRLGFDVPRVESPLKVNVAQLLVMGITKFASLDEANMAVAPLVGKPLGLHPAPPFPLEEIRLSARQARILGPLRKHCRIDELIAATGLPADEVSRLVYAMAVLGVVAPAADLPPEPAPAPTPAPAAPVQAPAPDIPLRPAPAAPDPAVMERVRNAVMQAFLSHRVQDPFDLLGLSEDANTATIQERYLEFGARYLPARFDTDQLRPVADKARDLFLAGARAYAELADLERRSALVTHRRTSRQQALARPNTDFTIKTDLLDPEVQYRKGRALLEAGQFHAAITQLEFASDCDPGNGLYRAELAWCRFQLSPDAFARRALAELEEAQRIDAKCGLAALYAGEILASLGSFDDAERQYRRALKLMSPDRRPVEALKTLQRKRR